MKRTAHEIDDFLRFRNQRVTVHLLDGRCIEGTLTFVTGHTLSFEDGRVVNRAAVAEIAPAEGGCR